MTIPTSWKPASLATLRAELGSTDWILCGGCSIDLLVGSVTRPHGDTDIGVFRSRACALLGRIDPSRVFLCSHGGHLPWDADVVPAAIRHIWVTTRDQRHWSFQVMLYDDADGLVTYHRDPRLQWPVSRHAIAIDGVPILNPVLTLLYKLQSGEVRDKDLADLRTLADFFARTLPARAPTPPHSTPQP